MRRIIILWGTQGGTARKLAHSFYLKIKNSPEKIIWRSLNDFPPSALLANDKLLIITSTYGKGKAPKTAKDFYARLHSRQHIHCSSDQGNWSSLEVGGSLKMYEYNVQKR